VQLNYRQIYIQDQHFCKPLTSLNFKVIRSWRNSEFVGQLQKRHETSQKQCDIVGEIVDRVCGLQNFVVSKTPNGEGGKKASYGIFW